MKITPIDIIHKSFGKKMMGIDAEEVHEFMAQIATQMEALLQERNNLKELIRANGLGKI